MSEQLFLGQGKTVPAYLGQQQGYEVLGGRVRKPRQVWGEGTEHGGPALQNNVAPGPGGLEGAWCFHPSPQSLRERKGQSRRRCRASSSDCLGLWLFPPACWPRGGICRATSFSPHSVLSEHRPRLSLRRRTHAR